MSDRARDSERVVHVVLEDALGQGVVDELAVLLPVDHQVVHLLGIRGCGASELGGCALVDHDVHRGGLNARTT